jgi:hypothetical protein
MRMLFAHGQRGDQAIAEPRCERFNGTRQRPRFRPRQIFRFRCRHANSSQL